MAYGLSTRTFSENGPAEQAARANIVRTPVRSWQALNEAGRLELIEQALSAANDRIDGYPLAL
ncbi:MAG TPA: hypothetical protein VF776_02100 [Sphingomicrobium sp.]